MSDTPEWYVTEYPEEGSFAVTDGYEIFAMISGGKTFGDECDLACRIAKLPDLERERDEAREKLADWENSAKHVRSEWPDEQHCSCVPILRKLLKDAERERDEAHHEIEGWRNKWECAVEMAARAENESEEQARLLGMSAEREESIRGKLFLAERELAKIKAAAKSVVEVWETPPWKIGETPSNAITQLRDAIGYED